MATHHVHRAVIDGLHPAWDPTMPVLTPFHHLPIRVGSFFDPRATDCDLLVTNERVAVEDDGERFRWRVWGREGTARFLLGTPRVDSPRAFLLPSFYLGWAHLALTPRSAAPRERGVSFVASNHARGELARRRVALALDLARHVPVHASAGLRGAFPADAPIRFHDVGPGGAGKKAFLERFTFNLALENEAAPGYLTEKVGDALLAGAVPIYEGAPDVADWLAPGSWVDATGLDGAALAARVVTAEREGVPELVASRRGRLLTVSHAAMMGRLWELAARIHDDLAAREPDWRDPRRVWRLRRESATAAEWGVRLARRHVEASRAGRAARAAWRRLRGLVAR
ncbi:MAG: hypothetical protein KC635_04605 [Myxococcales bacterium]|nr:hypothetical protein [Myxococcales bacterium]MCB9737431.1 hypothetical protein [Deltaproteobacteria bacterium]